MQANLSEILRSEDIHGTPWWTGAIQIRDTDSETGKTKIAPPHIYVLPVDDIADHIVGECPCSPRREFTGQWFRLLIVHNAFDGRE
jgi:RNA polymerase subunit RPABC4/transcription elongation factor Spt4